LRDWRLFGVEDSVSYLRCGWTLHGVHCEREKLTPPFILRPCGQGLHFRMERFMASF
jgi:hypothetical protein